MNKLMILENRLALTTEERVGESVNEKLSAMVSRNTRFVYQIAFSILRNHHDAEDVAQEAFLRVIRKQSHLEEIRDERAWLARVAWRLALTKRKRQANRLDLPMLLDPLGLSSGDPEQIASKREMMDIVERLIDSLPPELRNPLLLSTVEGVTSQEIGQILDVPDGTVRTRIARARAILERKLSALIGGNHGR